MNRNLYLAVFVVFVALSANVGTGQQLVATSNYTCVIANDASNVVGAEIWCTGRSVSFLPTYSPFGPPPNVGPGQSGSLLARRNWQHLASATTTTDSEPTDALCALDDANNAWCNGTSTHPVVAAWENDMSIRTTPMTQLALGEDFACGLRWNDSTVQCWGNMVSSTVINFMSEEFNLTFTQIAAGGRLMCGLPKRGGMFCWDRQAFIIVSPQSADFGAKTLWDSPYTEFGHLSIGPQGRVICAVIRDAHKPAGEFDPSFPQFQYPDNGDVVCWEIPLDLNGVINNPAKFVGVASGTSQFSADIYPGYVSVMVGIGAKNPTSEETAVKICALGFNGHVFCNHQDLTAAMATASGGAAIAQLSIVSGEQFCMLTAVTTSSAAMAVKCAVPICATTTATGAIASCTSATGFQTWPVPPHATAVPTISVASQDTEYGYYRIGNQRRYCSAGTYFATNSQTPPSPDGGSLGESGGGLATPMCSRLSVPGYKCATGHASQFWGSLCTTCRSGSSNNEQYSLCQACNATQYNDIAGGTCRSCPVGLTSRTFQGSPYGVGPTYCEPCPFQPLNSKPFPFYTTGIGNCTACNPEAEFQCPPGMGLIPRGYYDQTVLYTDPLEAVRQDSVDAATSANTRVWTAAIVVFVVLAAIGAVVHFLVTRDSKVDSEPPAFVTKIDFFTNLVPYRLPRPKASIPGVTLMLMFVAALGFIIASSVEDYQNQKIFTASLQPKYIPFRTITELNGKAVDQPPLVFWTSFALNSVAGGGWPLCSQAYVNVTINDFNLKGSRGDIYNDDYTGVASINIQPTPMLPNYRCNENEPGRRCASSIQSCNVTITCERCTFNVNPRIAVRIKHPNAVAAMIRFGMTVPYYPYEQRRGGGQARTTQFLTTHVPATASAGSPAVFRGAPTQIRVGFTTVVRADRADLLDENNPIGLVGQLMSVTKGQTIGNEQGNPADYFYTLGSTDSVGVDIVFQKATQLQVIRAVPAQTILNLVGQLISLTSGAFAGALYALIAYHVKVYGPDQSVTAKSE